MLTISNVAFCTICKDFDGGRYLYSFVWYSYIGQTLQLVKISIGVQRALHLQQQEMPKADDGFLQRFIYLCMCSDIRIYAQFKSSRYVCLMCLEQLFAQLFVCRYAWIWQLKLIYSRDYAYCVRTYMTEMKAKCTSLFGSKLNPIINVAFLLFTGFTVR